MPATSDVPDSFPKRAAKALSAWSRRARSRKRQVSSRRRALAFEMLGHRRVLAGYFDEIADEISGPSGVLTQASRGIDTISSVAKLPLINTKLEQVDKFNESLDKFRTQLDAKLRTLTPGTADAILESKLVELLGPGGANVLANRAAPDTIGVEDLVVASGPDSVDVDLDLGITNESFPSGLGLGIESVPLKPSSGTNGTFSAGVFYRHFRFGYNPTAGPYVDTSASNELELELKGYLPASFDAGLGFLNVRITDSSPGTNSGDEDVTIKLKADVADTGISAPSLGIDLNFQAHVNVQTTAEGMPELATDFKLQWNIPAVSPDAPLDGGAWTPPVLEFNNVTLSVGSFIKSVAQPIAKYVRDVIEPLEPVFNLLETRIPGISDVAETFGQSSINLVSLSNLLALSPNPPTQFIEAIRSAAKLRDLYATLTSLADRNAAGLIRLGNFSVSGPGGSSLLNASEALSNLGLPDWSSLVSSSGSLNFEQIKSQLRNELGAVGGEIADVLTKIASKAGPGDGDKAGFSFSFPIIENPSKVALGMFLGRDENLVSVGLDINFEIKKDIFIKIVPGVSILVRPNASVNAATEIGYDTRGLREAMVPLYAGSGFDANKLLNGLWISGGTHIDVSGSVGVGPVLGLPEFATVDVVLDVRLGVHAGLYLPPNVPVTAKRRFFAGDFNDGKLFTLSGDGKASLSATIKVGGEIPLVGFVGISKTWTFLETTFFSFTTDCVPMPGAFVNRPVIVPRLFDIVDVGDQRILRLKAGPWANDRGIGIDANGEYIRQEDFTVEFVRLDLNLPGQFPRVVPVIDVKAFGVVQRYRGRLDYVLAQMGDDNDSVQVTNASGGIIYIIHGDEGNDRINVDGNASVNITGGNGDDTIDGGNGTAASGSGLPFDGIAAIDGGNGFDNVSFGEGRLENLDPAAEFNVFDTSTDFIQDRFKIDNARSEIDTEYRFSTGERVGDVRIRPRSGGTPQYAFRFDATVGVDIFSGTGDDEFLGLPTPASSLYGGYGGDVFRPTFGLDRLPTRNLGGVGVYPSFNFNFYGGNDNDVLVVDDSLNTTPRNYNVNSDNWSNAESRLHWTEIDSFDSGVIRFSGIDDFTFKSGSESDSILISGVITAGLTIDSGSGNDRIVVGYLGPAPIIGGVPNPNPGSASIRGPLTIVAGSGNDTFELNNVSNRFLEYETIRVVLPDGSIAYRQVPSSNFVHYTVPLILRGGEGDNTLQIDDRQRRLSHPIDINETYYQIEYDRFFARTIYEADDDAAIQFSDVELRSLQLSDDPTGFNNVHIDSLSSPTDDSFSDLVAPFAIFGYQALDRFTLLPHDSQGNARLRRPMTLNGGGNFDQIVVNDVNSALPTTYILGGQDSAGTSSQQYIGGVTPGQLAYSSNIRKVELLGGSQNDTFNVDYTGYVQSLYLSGGLGDDLFRISPVRQDLASSIRQTTSLTIDGKDGRNSLKLFNDRSPYFSEFVRNGDGFIAHSPSQNFVVGATFAGLQSWELSGGLNTDVLYVNSVGSGDTTAFYGNSGRDYMFLGRDDSSVSDLRGQVIFDAGSDGGSLVVDNSANATGAVVHIDSRSDGMLGSAPGDTLFGLGGSLQFTNLTNDPVTEAGLTLTLGSGRDTVYAVPSSDITMSIAAGAPNSGVGDNLYLALAGVENPNTVGLGTGAGKLVSTNRKDVTWTGIENLDLNYVEPTVLKVTNTLDSGPGSLRQAILDANAKPNVGGPDVIRFALSGANSYSIRPLSQLPNITDPVVLDATTQAGYVGTPVVEIDGTLAGRSNGLVILSGGSTVRGLAFNRFSELSHVVLLGASNNVIQGNYFGTNLAGSDVYQMTSPTVWGIVVYGSDNNILGTNGDGVNDALEGNVISGHGGAGILFESGAAGQSPDNNVVAGNRIGTSADGSRAFGNGRMGIFALTGGTGNRIGTNSDGTSDTHERNLVSGNPEAGIYLGGNGYIVAGNYIGTDASGTVALPNGNGVRIERADNNRVGGTSPGDGNLIAYNNNSGVSIGTTGTGNSVLGNSVYANGELGIDLNNPGDPSNRVTLNDATDADVGPNNLQNFPTLSLAQSSNGQTTVGGTLNSIPQTTFRIEFFASPQSDPSGNGEGQTFLGFATATTDASGFASFATSFSATVEAGYFITSTATDPQGNTSEFSRNVQVVASLAPNIAALRLPISGSLYLVASPTGTSLSAAARATPGVTPPTGIAFPYGFLDFTVSGVAPGSAADVTIIGLNSNLVTDYFKYGTTPANRIAHWYNFLFGRATDSDSAVGTGMEIVNGNVVLHLIDGQRGDDDLVANGVIVDIGGAVYNRRPVAANDAAITYKNTFVTINVLANDSDSDGTLKPGTVSMVGAASRGTTSVNPNTGAITYTPASNYVGPDSFTYQVQDNLGAVSNVATVSITVKPKASISGKEFLDVTGNGLTADDLPLAGVKVYLDINNNGVWNTGEPSSSSLADGTYLLSDLDAGSYKVRQVTPSGYVRTGPAAVDNYSVSLTIGQSSIGNNFSNAARGNLSVLTNVVYVINGTTAVESLWNNTKEGDTVQVSFTVTPGTTPQRLTLVSYTAPDSNSNEKEAYLEKSFDVDSGVFGPGTHTLSVSNPHSYYHVYFVTGFAIDRFGTEGTSIFYSAQGRLIGEDKGGKRASLASPASLTGMVYRDANNNGIVDAGELPISGVEVVATSSSITQTVVTDVYGVYTFDNLPTGTYSISETQPRDYVDGKDTLGNRGGTLSNDKFSGIALASGVAATGYNFGERQSMGSAFAANETRTADWWNSTIGQSLIQALNGGSNAKNLGNWLSTNFQNLFGAAAGNSNDLTNKTNLQVANYFKNLYSKSDRKPETEILALALSTYVTNSGLAGTTASSATYGFAVSAMGLGSKTVNIVSGGAALGIKDNSLLTVTEILSRANARSRKGILWDMRGNGSSNAAEAILRNQARVLAGSINNT